jgi:CheY-like chemotaxis protein
MPHHVTSYKGVTYMTKLVLVVDDNKDTADTLEMVLNIVGGYNVVVAYSGNDAIELTKSIKPDVVLCDVIMPGIDGYMVARALRQTCQAKLVALTGSVYEKDRQKATEAGFDAFLAKPADINEILAVVKGER